MKPKLPKSLKKALLAIYAIAILSTSVTAVTANTVVYITQSEADSKTTYGSPQIDSISIMCPENLTYKDYRMQDVNHYPDDTFPRTDGQIFSLKLVTQVNFVGSPEGTDRVRNATLNFVNNIMSSSGEEHDLSGGVGSFKGLEMAMYKTLSFSGNGLLTTNGGSDASGGSLSMDSGFFRIIDKLSFTNNFVSSTSDQRTFVRGGAISVYGDLAFDDCKSIEFIGNKAILGVLASTSSGAFGGAIFCGKEGLVTIKIQNCGDVLFKNNTASTFGGAIYSRSILMFSADLGDITFVGNTHQLTVNGERNSGIANAIVLDGGGIDFDVHNGHTISFYDPISSVKGEVTISFGLSNLDSTSDYRNGTVLFSGAKVQETLAGSEGSADYEDRISESKKSIFAGLFVLGNCTLKLEEGVTIGSQRGASFDFRSRGMIDISNSTIIGDKIDTAKRRGQTEPSAGEYFIWKIGEGSKLIALEIDLGDGMGIDLGHYSSAVGFKDHGGMSVTADTIFMGGSLAINDNIDTYTDNKWSKTQSFTLMDIGSSDRDDEYNDFAEIKSKLTGSNMVDDPYQYQGEWTFTWEGSKLIATWKASESSEGIQDVRPELEGNIVANSMWSSASNARSLSRTALDNATILRLESTLRSNFWVRGIGDFAYDDSSEELDGYSYQGGGYAAGADFKIGAKSVAGVAFGQLIGDNKSELYNAKIKQDSMMGSIYIAHLQKLNKRNSLLWSLAGTYGGTDNSMNTYYSDGQNSEGSWKNNAYFVEAKMEWRIAPEGKSWTYKPFIGLEYTDVSSDNFTETGDKARHFCDGKYTNLALPIGMGVEHQSRFGKKTWLNSLSLAYVPDVYRDAPHTQATRLSNGFSWKNQGSKPSIHTLRASINSTLQLNSAWTVYAGYTFEAREGANYHNVNTGVSYSF